MEYELNRLTELLEQINPQHTDWMHELLTLLNTDGDAALRLLNSQQMWGGAGSIANDALADNPGMDDWTWESLIREFRTLMIDIATELKTREQHYPDIDFWLSSFTSWNA